MISLSQLVLPAGFLVASLNAAIASLVACGIALVLSRRAAWSLPVRHALLVAAFVASLLAPLFAPLFHFPSLWSTPIVATVEPLPPTADWQPTEAKHLEGPEPSIATAVPSAEVISQSLTSVESAPAAPVSVAADRILSAPNPIRQSLIIGQWGRAIGTLLCGVWFIGIAVGMASGIVGLFKLQRFLQSVTKADSPLIAAAASSAADGLRLRRPISICHSNLLPAPISLGLLRARVVVPDGIETSLPPDQLRAVIQHEMAHIARRDLWIGLLQQVAAIVYWWNPLVLVANRRLADLREQICDDIAIRGLPEPSAYAATLISLAERCSLCAPIPATLGIGSSPASQLESRVRRILSSSEARSIRLTRRAAVGVSATVVLMTATILLAQAPITSPATDKPELALAAAPIPPAAAKDPTLRDLIQQMAIYERMYLPYDIQAIETFRFPDDLTPQERAKNLRADGRKRQRMMEYAQLESRVWRRKETELVDDEVAQGPYEQFSDGERIIQTSPSSLTINGKNSLEIYVNSKKNQISNYLHATPLVGVFCLSSYSASELFSEAFKADEEAVELTWDNGDAKLTFGYGRPQWNMKFVLWLSRAHAWHPIRLQRFWDAKDPVFHEEWEVTRFARRGKEWRIAEGTQRYRERNRKDEVENPNIAYSIDFKILTEKYGSGVDERQFKFEIPAGAKVRDDQKPDAEPPPTAKTREITVTVIDVAGRPIRNATVRLPRGRFSDLDRVTTDDNGIARSAKASADDVTVQITAEGFRPVTWILGAMNQLQAIMVPQSPGVVLDQGQPVADAWITNEPLQIRADGFAYVPAREWDGRDKDWSSSNGKFELKTNLTLRRRDAVIPVFAIHPDRDKMAIQFVPAAAMGQQQELALQSVCHVQGHCLLEGMTESVEVDTHVESADGQYIGSLSTRKELIPEGLRVDFQLRLPPGDYLLTSRQSSHHAGFRIPFTVPKGKDELDLRTKTAPLSGTVALRGKSAPELNVQWRPGQETDWEKLRGKVVVLDFWGTWCGPCVADMPLLMEIADQFRDKPVQWLSIHTPNLKTFEELDQGMATCQEKSWNKRALPFTTVIDTPLSDQEYTGQTSRRYGVAEWPTLIVVDPQGQVVGPIPKKRLAETIARLLDGGAEK